MERIEEIINKYTEGNYLLSGSDKHKMISEILDLFSVSKSLVESERLHNFDRFVYKNHPNDYYKVSTLLDLFNDC